jgi:hypothetical protein
MIVLKLIGTSTVRNQQAALITITRVTVGGKINLGAVGCS